MVAPAVIAAFLIGLLLEATIIFWLDRRAIAREEAWWAELRADALDGYGRIFDWAEEDA